ncbi:efflux RND transporter permease subunit [Myxococcota bacterium]|nr:efflux RND transporter permease subunit [Myxococcota bacterium]
MSADAEDPSGGAPRRGWVDAVIEACAHHPVTVVVLTAALVLGAVHAIRKMPLDAIPDLGDPQVIVTAEWMGRGAELVDDQVTTPVVTALRGTPGARAVRGFSMFGMAFVYALFDEGTDLYRARGQVSEALSRARLPADATAKLGPDATGVGWVFNYALTDPSGATDLATLRTLQDGPVRAALESVPGVAEVAGLGGDVREIQIVPDPDRLRALGVTVETVAAALRGAQLDAGGGVLHQAGREYALQVRGRVARPEDFASLVLRPAGAGTSTPLRLGDVATITTGRADRRGIAELDGMGEVVGGIVVMRDGENALAVIERVKARLPEIHLPHGVELVTTYDRSALIEASIGTLTRALLEEALVVSFVVIVFLMHFRSALVVILVLPVAVLLAFVPMAFAGITSNIMSLGGIAIAIGAMVDACVVLVENAHKRLEHAPPDADRRAVLVAAAREVGRPIFFSLLLITVSFLPVFALEGQGGRLFGPLAFTKTASMFFAALLSVTLAPALMVWFVRGRIRSEADNPVSRVCIAIYRPFAWVALHNPKTTALMAVAALVSAAPLAARLGSEFMPPLDEGSLLYMPTTLPGIGAPLARDALVAQDRAIATAPEVARVFGKVGRADTATDPAPLDMVETVITLKPRDQWRKVPVDRFWSGWAPDFLVGPLRAVFPDERPISPEALIADLDGRLSIPGFTNALVPPIKTRIDMLSTGIRTPLGVRVQGDALATLEAVAAEVAAAAKSVRGARGVFAERVGGATTVDVVPNLERLARFGLNPADVSRAVDVALGGAPLTWYLEGRTRVPVTLRMPEAIRDSPAALRRLPVALPGAGPAMGGDSAGSAMPDMGGRRDPGVAEPPENGRAMLAQGMPGMNMDGGGAASPGGGAMGGMGASGAGLGEVPRLDVPMGLFDPGSGGASPMSGMGTGMASGGGAARPGGGAPAPIPFIELGEVADVVIRPAPSMIKNENGRLALDVFVDVDTGARDLGGFVSDVRAAVDAQVPRRPGVTLTYTGQYEEMLRTEARLRTVLPLTLALVVGLLWLNFRSWARTLIVLLSVPFALVGSVWLLAALGHPLSTAVWVGLIALVGVAAETGIVMLLYLDESCDRAAAEGRLTDREALRAAILEGAVGRVRPKLMTVGTMLFGLVPLLWSEGAGADVMSRIAAPLVGGLITSAFLTLEIIPVVYLWWRGWRLPVAAPLRGTPTSV